MFEVVVEGSLEGKADECQMENNCPMEGSLVGNIPIASFTDRN